jgi:hypothetical protein
MGLKRANEIKIVENTNILEFKPDENESVKIKRIEVKGATSGDYAQIYIGRAIVGYFAVNCQGYNHLAPVIAGENQENLMVSLQKKGIDLTYPVADGETFSVKLNNNAEFIKIVYDVYDAGDIHADMPNGSKAKELTYIAYLTNANEITSGDYYTLDKIINPVEFENFPVEPVASKAKIDVLGMMGIPVAASVGDGTNTLGTSYTTRVRIFYQRKVLFDPDRLGHLFLGNKNYTETGTTKTYDHTEYASEIPFVEQYNKKLFMFDPVLSFGPGEEVNFQIGVNVDPDVSIDAEKLMLALIMKITYE